MGLTVFSVMHVIEHVFKKITIQQFTGMNKNVKKLTNGLEKKRFHVSWRRYPLINLCGHNDGESIIMSHHHHHHLESSGEPLLSLPHYHKSDLGLIDANGPLFFSIINRTSPWPQAVIKAVIFSYSLKQRARPGRDPGREGDWKDLCPSSFVFLQLGQSENSVWSESNCLFYDSHNDFYIQTWNLVLKSYSKQGATAGSKLNSLYSFY